MEMVTVTGCVGSLSAEHWEAAITLVWQKQRLSLREARFAVARLRQGDGFLDCRFPDAGQAAEFACRLGALGFACMGQSHVVAPFPWLCQAAEGGGADAQFLRGLCHKWGCGTAQDGAEAVRWFRQAAEQGHPGAQMELALCFWKGVGLPEDKGEAIRWFRRAAAAGHAQSQYLLSLAYRGVGDRSPDETEEVRWLRRAAEQGDEEAQNDLGACCLNGRLVEQDHAEAVRWFRLAAEHGMPEAMNNLGLCYAKGWRVGRDGKEAVRWYERGAALDHADSLYNLATHLGWQPVEEGGAGQLTSTALTYLHQAAAQGHESAIALLKRIGPPG